MKKLISLVAITVAMLCLLASCNSFNKNPNPTPNPDPTPDDGSNVNPDSPNDDSQDVHVHTFGDWTITKQATCGEEGLLSRTCSECGEVEENKILPTGIHKQADDAPVAPTCTSVGLSSGVHCSECGMVIVAQQELPMVDHTYSGENDATCNKCGFTRDVVCAHGVLINIPAKEATCTESGLTESTKCANCMDIITAPEYLPPLGHTEVVTDALAPTCTEPGYTSSTSCSTCGETLVYKTDIPARGHKATEWIIEKDPTESEEGLKYKVCTVCSARFDDTAIPFVSANGIAYEPNAIGNTCTVTGIGTFDGEELVIPDYISGYRVTAIADSAFQNCTKLTKLVLPETVKTIGQYAFSGCTGLTEFTIPASVTYIGNYIFYGNVKMTTVYYNSNYVNYDNLRGYITKVVFNGSFVPAQACYGCYNIKEIEFGSNVTDIKEGAFYGCTGLTKVVIPEGVVSIGNSAFSMYGSNGANLSEISLPTTLETIGDNAFYNARKIESLTIPYGVTSIGGDAFRLCIGLKAISLPDSLTTVGSAVFSGCSSLTSVTIPKGLTALSYVMFSGCGLTSVVIPGNIATIGSEAFKGCPLVNVIIEEGITTIKSGAFSGCTQLTGVVLPKSLKTIEGSAFNCISLIDVYYAGTQEEWTQISIVTSGNATLINAEKYYNYVR